MNWWRKIWIGLFVLTAAVLLSVDSRLMVDAAYLTLAPLAGGALVLLFCKGSRLEETGAEMPAGCGIDAMWKRENRFHLVLSVLCTILFVPMLSASQILGSGLCSYSALQGIYPDFRAGFYRGFTCSLYPVAVAYACVLLFFQLFQYAVSKEKTEGFSCVASDRRGSAFLNNGEKEIFLKKIRFLGIYVYLIPVALLILAYLWCSFPNYMLADSFMCWDQAVAGEWNDWDPIGYIFFLRLCSEIWDSFWIVRIIQSILYLYICNTALGLLYRLTHSLKACKIYVAAASLVLTPYIYLQLTYKDVLFTMSLFAFSLCLLDCVTKERVNWKNTASFVAFGLVMVLFRHGSLVPVLAGAAALFLVLFLGKRKGDCLKMAGSLAAVLALKLLIVDLLAFQILDTVRNPGYVSYSLPMVLAGGMASDAEVELTEDEKTVMEIITPLEHWRECFADTGNGYWADPIARDWSTIGGDIHKIDEYDLGEPLLRLNFSLFRRYPVKYLTLFFNCNSLVWEMGRPVDGYEWAPVEGTCFEFAQGYPTEEEMPRTAMTNIMLQISNASSRIPIVRSFTWRGGIWTFVLLLSGLLLLRKRRFKEAGTLLPVLVVLAMLMLAIPAQDPRYVLGGIECGIFFGVYAVFVPVGLQRKHRRRGQKK